MLCSPLVQKPARWRSACHVLLSLPPVACFSARGVFLVDWALSVTSASQLRNVRAGYLFLNVFLDSGFSCQFGMMMP